LSSRSVPVLTPRKTPVQARSTASVEAILQATAQVLEECGKQKLTTTRVAARAGVSVGTLYQYFPNKSSLLQAALRRHLQGVADAVERVCEEQKGCPLRPMMERLIHGFLDAKLADTRYSAAFYSVSTDVDGSRIAEEMSRLNTERIRVLLESSPEKLAGPVKVFVFTLLGMLAGVSRKLLETPQPERHAAAVRKEMVAMAVGYLEMSRG